MHAHAIVAIRTKYSKSSNPEQYKLLSVIRSLNVKEAIIAFFKVRALYGHKEYWVPKLALQLTTSDLLDLINTLLKIQHPSDLKSLEDQPLTRALSGERFRVSKSLLAQLLYAPYFG